MESKITTVCALPTARGFTLIEVLVVVLLMAIVLSMVGIRIGHGGDSVRREADRLSLLLQTAQQEAILQGKMIALAPGDGEYGFQGIDDKNKFVDWPSDPVLRRRELPANMSMFIRLDGVPAEKDARIILSPTGELYQAFTITLELSGARWEVEGSLDGTIQSISPDAPHA